MNANAPPGKASICNDEVDALTARLRKLAEDKSNLQLIVRLMEHINPLPGVEDMIRALLASIVETIGGTNIKLYYWIGTKLHYADFAGRSEIVAEIDDPSVARVAQSREFLEEPGGETRLTKEQFAGAWTWTFPLVVGADLVGVIKIENLHISGSSLRNVLPVFFSHAALILSNEIRNFARRQAEQALAQSEANIRQLMKKVPIALSHTSTDFTVLDINDRFVELFGYTLDDMPTLTDWWPRAYPDPAYRQELHVAWDAALAKAMQEGTDLPPVEVRITCKNGEERVVEVSTVMVADGAITAFVDLTERKRAEEVQKRLNRELRAISDCNQALMRAEDEQVLLDQICRIVCDEAGYRVAFVAYAEHDAEQTVRPVAWAGMDEGYFADAKLTWADRDLGLGPLGTAIRTGQIVEITDIETDPRMAPWRDKARARGYRSGVAFPLKDDQGTAFGGLLIYSGEANAITAEEIRLLDELAGDLAFGIRSLRLRTRQEEAKEKLSASEQLFRALVENSPDFIARYDREFRRVYANPTIRSLFTAPIDEVLGNTPSRASPLVDPDRYMADIGQVIETASEFTDEGAYRTLDGDIRWCSMRFAPEFGPDGKVATVLAISHDITERKQAEEIQKRLNRELRAISDCNQALLRAEDEQALLDDICRIICEEAGYRMAWVGYAENDDARTVHPRAWAGEEAGYLALTGLTWADTPAGHRPFGIAIRSGEASYAQDFASEMWSAPWTEHALQRGYRSGIALPLKNEKSDTFGALCIYSTQTNAFTPDEITLLEELAGDLAFGITSLRLRAQQEESKRQLAASEQLFRALVENSPDPIARYDRELRRIYVNPAIRKLFKEPVEQVLGKTPARVSPLLDPDSYMANIRRVIETAEECTDEGAARTLDGEIHWSSWRFTPEFGSDGTVATVLVISHDITERKRAEDERKAHLHFLESMDRVNRAIQGADDLERMMSDVLDVVLDIFDCDRAYLLHPCDPGDTHWTVPMERTRPEYPGALALGQPIPMDSDVATTLQTLLDHPGPVILGPGAEHPMPRSAAERFGIKAFIAMALRPKTGKPWQLGLHQCSRTREWNPEEVRLFEEIGRRLSDGLNGLLITRNLRESEERFRLVFESSPLPIWEEDFSVVKARLDELKTAHGTALEGYLIEHPEIVKQCAELACIVDVNQAAVDLHEAGSKEALFKGLACTFTDESYAAFREELLALANGETEMLIDSTVQTLTGKRRDVTVYFSVCPGHEHSLGKVLVSLIDITERKRSEDNLRLAASVFATSQEGIVISDPDNRIIDVNPAFTRLTGYEREEALGRNPGFLSSRRHNADFYAAMWRSIKTRGAWQGEIWNRRKSGEAFAELLSIIAVKDDHGQLQHYVGAFSDISILKEHEADLDRIAHYDVLTSVPNRRLLGDRLEQAIARARRLGKNLAVCYLDLDGFKPINDQFGHEGGDRLLVEIARRLQAHSRGDDTVARLGGDEFVLLWNDIGHESECFQALDRILAEVSSPMILDGVPVSVSASIGVTMFPDDDVDADSLLRHADHAMYSAKQLGKNRYQLFDSRLERQISSRVEFLSKVANGLDSGQFELYYQPKVDCVAGRLIGVEALIRWHDPILGLVGPKEFLPLIENDNLAFRMGRWVMGQAVRQARHWHEAGLEVPISINLFPRHLKFPTFIDDLRDAIAREWPGMPANRLMMEIVETSDLEELDPIEAVINECLGMGIGFSLDDFGTGYSSLVYLRRLSVEELKIDQSFVRDMMSDPNDQAIVAGVIALGTAFNLRVVAEGVESPEQARHLVAMGCSTVQGYGFGRPMPAEAVPEWLSQFLSLGVKP